MHKFLSIVALIGFSISLNAQQTCPELLEGSLNRLRKDIGYLASDDLAGRAPGTKGIALAGQYIEEEFKKVRLEPFMGTDYKQKFQIAVQVKFGQSTNLVVEEDSFKIHEDFYPIKYSASREVKGHTVFVKYGIVAPDLKYNDYKKLNSSKLEGKIFVMDVSSPDGIHPHSAYLKYHDLGERIVLAKEKGAIAVILVNKDGTANDASPKFRTIHDKGIPVVFVSNKELVSGLKKKKEVSLTTELIPNKVEAYNLVGYLNNKARHTVVIGAHYDHLGMGENNSLSADKKPQVHNGADDNASGVAGMLEMARNIAQGGKTWETYNYLFIAFSGEEMGLLGSAYFTDNVPHLKDRVKFMLNLDMIGRLGEDEMLAVNGIGTTKKWEQMMLGYTCEGLKFKTSASGIGPSDHTNFYYKDIPALHFFTGTHTDYHKPSDDVDKINLKGEQKVIRYMLGLIESTMAYEEMQFTPTKEASMDAPKFSVTLGVMPDYMYEGEGMRIDGVTEGRTADNAGMKAGDVVVKLGDVKVVDMMSYMKALGQFKKGDETEVEFLREGTKMTAALKF